MKADENPIVADKAIVEHNYLFRVIIVSHTQMLLHKQYTKPFMLDAPTFRFSICFNLPYRRY